MHPVVLVRDSVVLVGDGGVLVRDSGVPLAVQLADALRAAAVGGVL